MVRYHVILDGRVQRVGCRFFCQLNATKLSLTGWVKNLENGMVELEVQGNQETLDKYISIISKGNHFIRVDDYSIKKKEPVQNERAFKTI